MYEGVFIFGSKVSETRRDIVSSLPLELSWKIFLYLDKQSLSDAIATCRLWKRIIVANRELRSRLNYFMLVQKLGSERRANFYETNKKIMKKLRARNYLPVLKSTVESSQKTVIRSKRGGDDLVIFTKRYRLY